MECIPQLLISKKRNIGELHNEFVLGIGGNQVMNFATRGSWVQICPEGGNEVIWGIAAWDRVRSKVCVIGIWKEGKISVTAQKDAVLWIFVEVKDLWKINLHEVVKTES